MTSTLDVLRVNDKANIDNIVYRQGVRMTSTGTNTCIETDQAVIYCGLSDLLEAHGSASTL